MTILSTDGSANIKLDPSQPIPLISLPGLPTSAKTVVEKPLYLVKYAGVVSLSCKRLAPSQEIDLTAAEEAMAKLFVIVEVAPECLNNLSEASSELNTLLPSHPTCLNPLEGLENELDMVDVCPL